MATNKVSDQQWVQHFEGLLSKGHLVDFLRYLEERPWLDNQLNQEMHIEELDEMFSLDEVKRAVSRMANGKSSGEDGIPIECLKVLSSEDIHSLVVTLNKIWVDGKMPNGWEKARIVPLFKDEDRNNVSNYRGISLLNVGYKILTNLLANRLNNWADKENKLKESQAGFRRKRGSRDLIFVLNTLINKRQ